MVIIIIIIIIIIHGHFTVSFIFTVVSYINPNASLCHCIPVYQEFLSHCVSYSSNGTVL